MSARTLTWTAIAAAGVAAAAILARQRARHNRELAAHAAQLIECLERLDDYDKALSLLGVVPVPGVRLSSRLRLVRENAS